MLSTVEFIIWNVPDSWSNNRPWSRQANMGQHRRMKDWMDQVVLWGNIGRHRAGWGMATEGHVVRNVSIHQMRHGTLDDDNLFTSVKPILDGCKTNLRRKKTNVFGAGLIWNDNPKHCRLSVTQERIPLTEPCRVIIKVERFDNDDAPPNR